MSLENRVDISKPSDILLRFEGSCHDFYRDTSLNDTVKVQHKVRRVQNNVFPDQPMYEELFHAYPKQKRSSTQIHLDPSHPYRYQIEASVNTDNPLNSLLFQTLGFSQDEDSRLSTAYCYNLILEDEMCFYEALEFSDAIYSGITKF